MIRHFLRIGLRNLARNKAYSFINITGLAIGLAGFIIVLVYLNYELSYDRWSPELTKAYRISVRTDEEVMEQTPAPLGRLLEKQVPGIMASTTIQAAGDMEVAIKTGEKTLYSTGSVEVDSSFLQVFPYKLVSGNASTALAKPNAILISSELSKSLFGDADPIGKSLKLFNYYDNEITGVFAVPDGPSFLNAQFIWRSEHERQNFHWNNYSYHTYVKLSEQISSTALETKINPVYYHERLKDGNKDYNKFRSEGHQAGLFVDPVSDIHNFPKHGNSQFSTIMVLLVLAFLLLIAGAVNFSNLTIAASIRRAKEVGIRKAMGSRKGQLVGQFLGETALQCLISLALGLIIVFIALPWFGRAFNIPLSLFHTGNGWSITAQITGCLVLVILLSGLYPSVFLSVLNTIKVLKGEYSAGTKGSRFRNSLIVVQFVVAAFFVFGTVVINRQVHYMRTRDRGFSGQQVMRIEAMQQSRDAGFATTRNILSSIPGVSYVSKTTEVPGDGLQDTSTYRFRVANESFARLGSVKVSTDYFRTLDIQLLKGRFFDGSFADEHTQTVIVNESAAKVMGGGDVINRMIAFDGCDTSPVRVVGVVKDFVVGGYEQAVHPMAYTIGNNDCMFQSGGAILVKMSGARVSGTVAAVEQAWKKIEPDLPLRYSFLDDNFSRLLASYDRLQTIISIFTITAILISIIGLFAITAYLTGQRSKEIGVRKVLGASVLDLTKLLSRDFVRLVLIAIIIAAPLAWWAGSSWLNTFAYRIQLNWLVFGLSAFVLLLVALITVTVQTLKAANSNPVKSLRMD